MVPPWLLLGTERRAVLGSAKAACLNCLFFPETWGILEYRKIPGSINIPLDEVGEALQMNPRDFKEKYNEVKPSKSD
uniref:Uncharacterized protein n=1 Tax=Cercocebus atys TaxID=9531 RepID=A0A2K5LBW0_CERAT